MLKEQLKAKGLTRLGGVLMTVAEAKKAGPLMAAARRKQAARPTTRAAVTSNKPRNRVQIVAEAVQRDRALQGKAEQALFMLADPAFANVTGAGIVKALKAGVTASPPTVAATEPAEKARDPWASVIARMHNKN